MVFTRTKHGAKALARQLNKNGVPSVELHGNLAQNARTRNLDAFHSGKASTLVATDIAARGIHVDDVALVVHADPPVEHKAYLHRSGRTARAGAAGTVITLMTDDQVRDVRTLTRLAGIKPTTTKVPGPGHPILVELAPGERTLVPGGYAPAAPPAGRSAGEQGQRALRWRWPQPFASWPRQGRREGQRRGVRPEPVPAQDVRTEDPAGPQPVTPGCRGQQPHRGLVQLRSPLIRVASGSRRDLDRTRFA